MHFFNGVNVRVVFPIRDVQQVQRRACNLANQRQPSGIEPDGSLGADAGQPFVRQGMQERDFPTGRQGMLRAY